MDLQEQTERQRQYHGRHKVYFDGLVTEGILKNDGWGEVRDIKHSFYIDKDDPRINVILTEVEK